MGMPEFYRIERINESCDAPGAGNGGEPQWETAGNPAERPGERSGARIDQVSMAGGIRRTWPTWILLPRSLFSDWIRDTLTL